MPSDDSFLAVLKRAGRDDAQDGDRFGGGEGNDGSGLPDGADGSFRFATGVECSNPTIEHGAVRRDLLAETGHYDRFEQDLGLVRDLGLRTLRYGLPIHRVLPARGVYDWSFADAAMHEMRRLEIEPILDLLHFGVPDWWGDFQNPELPLLFCDYCDKVAERYPWVRFYTPVNEIFVTARNSARDGLWNEQRRDDRSFVTAMKNLVAADIMGCQALAARRNDLVVVQSESAEYTHDMRASPSPEVKLSNELRFLSLDLLYANPPSADVMLYLLDNGLTREEYAWFMRGEPPGYQIMGCDYYGRNEKIIKPDGGVCAAEDVLGWYEIVQEYFDRYRKPVMHTETNVFDPDTAGQWLWKQWANALRMRHAGVPMLGFTWYSLIDQLDWDVQLAEKRGQVNACGLYDLQRRPRPVAEEFRALLQEFGRISVMPHAEILTLTNKPAKLKVET